MLEELNSFWGVIRDLPKNKIPGLSGKRVKGQKGYGWYFIYWQVPKLIQTSVSTLSGLLLYCASAAAVVEEID
ncbi:MAG: hypothetical protein ACFB2W_24435 [Leptolyngbyaceae cyanobacterium]